MSGKVVVSAAPDIKGLSLMMIVGDMLGASYTETIDPAIDRLAELAPSVQTWEPNPDPYTMVLNGTAALGIGWNSQAQYYADTSDGHLGVVLPDEGSVFQTDTINLVKNSDSPRAAQTFINYALSPEAQLAFAEQLFYAPTNTETKVDAETSERTATSPERREQMLDIDWNYVAAHVDEWTERWRRDVVSR